MNRRYADNTTWSVDKCADCSHGFMNPQPSWEELAPYYSEAYPPYDPSHGSTADDEMVLARARAEGEFRHLPLPAGKKLLDVGCGAGFFLRISNQLGAVGKGIEPSDLAAERARSDGLDVFTGTLEDYVATVGTDEKFDVITASHVIEHVPDPVTTLSLMKQLLAPGGMAWVAVPNSEARWVKVIGTRWHSIDLPYHLMQFTPHSMGRAAENAGLNIRRPYTYSLPSAVAASMRLVLRYRLLMPGAISTIFVPPTTRRAAATGSAMDARCEGEAILIELALISADNET